MLNSLRRLGTVGLVVALVLGLLPLPAAASVGSCLATLPELVAIQPGSYGQLVFSLKNTSGSAITWFRIERSSADYSIDSVSVDGWSMASDTSGATFSGVALAPGDTVTVQIWTHPGVWQRAPANWLVRAADNDDGSGAIDCGGSRVTSAAADLSGSVEGQGISDITLDQTATSAIVRWQSDVVSGSAVSIGETAAYGTGEPYDLNLVTGHQVVVSGLKPGTGYYFRVEGVDENGHPIYSGDNTFVTLGTSSTGSTPVVKSTSKPSLTSATVSGAPTPKGTIAIKAVPTEKVVPTVSVSTSLAKPFTKGVTIAGKAGDNVAVARVDYSLDGGKSWVVVPSPPGLGTKAVNWAFTAVNLEDGNYSLVVRVIDTSGNAAVTVPVVLVADRLPPQIGSELVSYGPQAVTPDAQGRWQAAVGLDQKLTLNAVGGPVSLVVTATPAGKGGVSTGFYLRHDEDSGLWTGLLGFRSAGVYHLTAAAVDGAGNQTSRNLSDVVVAAPARVTGERGKGLAGARVTLYERSAATGEWAPWNGPAYGQANPVVARADGSFALWAPKGAYYLKAEAPGYRTMITREFKLDRPMALTPALSMAKQPRLSLGSWSWVVPGITLSRTAVNPVAGEAAVTVASPLVGQALPAFALPTTAGTTMTAVSLQGRPTVITVLSTWAPTAGDQLTALAKVAARGASVNVVSMYVGEHADKVRSVLLRGDYGLLGVVDADITFGVKLGVPNVPTHYFVNREGRVVAVVTGVLSESQLLAHLTGL